MKRLFGLSGVLYLANLTAVFYFKSLILFTVLGLTVVLLICLAVLRRVQNKKYMFATYLTAAVTIVLAALSIFLYQNYCVNPIQDNYSDKEIYVEGYVCEEITYKDKSAEYLIQTTAVDSNSVNTKIRYTGYSENDVREFDCVKLHVKAYTENNEQNIGHRILLKAYETSPYCLTPTGESRFTLYKYAVDMRKNIREALNKLLPRECAGLSRAVLLGDKYALDDNDLRDFRQTGTSFLIVVSGLHLSIAVAVAMLIMRRFTKRRVLLSIGAIAAVICFAALTGFNYSVIRAGISMIIYQIGRIFLRNSDPLNSLGFAALVITIPNPYAVGDLGLLMSFSATFGIILWNRKIYEYIIKKLHFEKLPYKKRFQLGIKRTLHFLANLFAVSLSASIWIIPITVIAFGTISPLTTVISLITEPIASAILGLSLLCSALYLFPIAPVITYLAAAVNTLLCKLLLGINGFFAGFHISSIKADTIEVYIWLAVSVLLVVIGYLIKAKKNYIVIAANISFALIIAMSVVSFFTADRDCTATLYKSGNGFCAEVKKENNISLLNAGGNNKSYKEISADIYSADSQIDFLIIPNSNKDAELLQDISENFNINNIITGSESEEDMRYIFNDVQYIIQNNTVQTINLNSDSKVTLIDVKGIIYQYLQINGKGILIVPVNSDIEKLPEKFRTAEYIVLEGIPKNYDLLSCDKLIYAGSINSFYKEKLLELKEIYPELLIMKNNKLEVR